MKRFYASVAIAAFLAACGSSGPFGNEDGETTPPDNPIPDSVAGDLTSFTYDPTNQTLVVNGVSLDNTPIQATYTRNAALDVDGYEAYTNQQGPLTRHNTAYVQEIDGTRAAIVVSGGQFGHYFGGGYYERTGGFDAPDISGTNGIVQYAGKYVGLLNISDGIGADLLPVPAGTSSSVTPTQAAEITGDVLISADFADNSVEGTVFNRAISDYPSIAAADLEFEPGTIGADGTFTGNVTQGAGNDRGDYGGIFGGTDSSAVAGALYAEDHIDSLANIEEHGVFVLNSCNGANAHPDCP